MPGRKQKQFVIPQTSPLKPSAFAKKNADQNYYDFMHWFVGELLYFTTLHTNLREAYSQTTDAVWGLCAMGPIAVVMRSGCTVGIQNQKTPNL